MRGSRVTEFRLRQHCSSHLAGVNPYCFTRIGSSFAAAPRRRQQPVSNRARTPGSSSRLSKVSASAGGYEDACSNYPEHKQPRGWHTPVLRFVQAQYLPLALISGLLLGGTFPSLGLAAANLHIPALTTFGIFIIQGLQLRRKEAAAALSAKGAVLYGLLSILFLTPLLGLLAVQLPLRPPALALGLGVFCCMPTALSSGVTFSQQVGANVPLALLLTVTSNILGVFTMPFILPHVVAASPLAAAGPASGASGAMLHPLPLLVQLCWTILLPTTIGASLRGIVPGAAAFIDARKKLLSYLSAGLLALVPWMQVSKTASQKVAVDVLGIAGAAAAGMAIHAAFLTLNMTACRILRLGGSGRAGLDVQRALILVSSVKTLPVAVTVCSQLTGLFGDAVVGVAVVPCVLAHLGQIICDSFIVGKWMSMDRTASAAKQA